MASEAVPCLSNGLTSKGKLLGRAFSLNAYAHAVCIVWHWSARLAGAHPTLRARSKSDNNAVVGAEKETICVLGKL